MCMRVMMTSMVCVGGVRVEYVIRRCLKLIGLQILEKCPIRHMLRLVECFLCFLCSEFLCVCLSFCRISSFVFTEVYDPICYSSDANMPIFSREALDGMLRLLSMILMLFDDIGSIDLRVIRDTIC